MQSMCSVFQVGEKFTKINHRYVSDGFVSKIISKRARKTISVVPRQVDGSIVKVADCEDVKILE